MGKTLEAYIYRGFQKNGLSMNMSKQSVGLIARFLCDVSAQVVREAGKLSRRLSKHTISYAEMRTALYLIMPCKLCGRVLKYAAISLKRLRATGPDANWRPQSIAERSGLTLPPHRIQKIIREQAPDVSVSKTASFLLTAVLEALSLEVLRECIAISQSLNRNRIDARTVRKVILDEQEFRFLVRDVITLYYYVSPPGTVNDASAQLLPSKSPTHEVEVGAHVETTASPPLPQIFPSQSQADTVSPPVVHHSPSPVIQEGASPQVKSPRTIIDSLATWNAFLKQHHYTIVGILKEEYDKRKFLEAFHSDRSINTIRSIEQLLGFLNVGTEFDFRVAGPKLCEAVFKRFGHVYPSVKTKTPLLPKQKQGPGEKPGSRTKAAPEKTLRKSQPKKQR